MTQPFEQKLRDELMAATTRRRRRPGALALAAIAVICAAATLAVTVSDSDPAAADVEVTHEDGRVIVRLNDLENSPADVEEATDAAGLDVRVEGVPAGPSQVGRFVGAVSTDSDADDIETLDTEGVTYLAFSLPEDWDGTLTVLLGQQADPGEPYRIASDAFLPGEPLGCSELLGQPLEAVVEPLDGLDVTVQAFDDQQQPSAPMTVQEALDNGFGDDAVTGATATSSGTVLVDTGRDVPPRTYPTC